tara:strand:- start:710 stop:1474 length:765 start_codon:yes stop_codon:yes gene_type:complete
MNPDNQNFDILIAKPREFDAKKKEDPKLTSIMKEGIIPKHPFSICMTAPSGSGKSTLLLHMLEHPQFYGHYFDRKNIHILSKTAKSDPLYRDVDVPKKNIHTSNFQSVLDTFIKKRARLVERKGKENTHPTLMIFEDSTNEKKFMKSKSFLDSFVLLRHYNVSIISVIHKLRSLERTARMSVGHLICFPCSLNEVNTIVDDFAPSNMNKKEFRKLVHYAFQPSDTDTHPFLYICNKAPFKTRYRKGFHTILELT